jgi:hypothetical protein
METDTRPDTSSFDYEPTYEASIKLTDELLAEIEAALRGAYSTFGATPFDMIFALASQQDVLENRLQLFSKSQTDIPTVINDYARDTFVKRFWQRLKANDENLMTSLLFRGECGVDERILPMVERGKSGGASPAELMLLRNLLGTRSLEVACLSHPNGEGIEQLVDMRLAVMEAVLILGGEYDDSPTPRYSMKEVIYDEDGTPAGVFMTRKMDYGLLPDETVIRERSSFILRIDELSDFRDRIGDESVNEFIRICGLDKAASQIALKPFNDIISSFLESNNNTQAIPLSTTTYAFNKKVAELLLQLNIKPEYEAYNPVEPSYNPVQAAVEINELQQVLNNITEGYKNEIYQSAKPQ